VSTDNPTAITARAFFRAIALPGFASPYDHASLKIFYPARRTDSEEERNTGVVPPAADQSPFPVVIMLPGINVGPEAYSWLAQKLAHEGVVTVTFTHVAEEMPGYISLTPGLDISALMPADYGQRPSATAIAPIIEELRTLNSDGLLAGLLDLQKIVLGGHSAGGTVALLNANPEWFPGVCGSFSYGAHSAAATALGYEEDALFVLPGKLPTLIMGGTRDGCIANSAARYGKSGQASATAAIERTFHKALQRSDQDCFLALIEGANHFSMAYPADHSTGRPFIDMPTTQPDGSIRELLAALVSTFVGGINTGDMDSLEALMQQHQGQLHLNARR
jgi:dienelactone hydrolase